MTIAEMCTLLILAAGHQDAKHVCSMIAPQFSHQTVPFHPHMTCCDIYLLNTNQTSTLGHENVVNLGRDVRSTSSAEYLNDHALLIAFTWHIYLHLLPQVKPFFPAGWWKFSLQVHADIHVTFCFLPHASIPKSIPTWPRSLHMGYPNHLCK